MEKKNLLIADDEINIRNAISSSFSDTGRYKTFLAKDGEEAYQLIVTKNIHAAIMDIRMPKMDGIEILHKINQSKNKIPIILITGHGTIETAVKSMQEGAYDFMIKPVNLDKIEVVLERAFKEKALKEENKQLNTQIKNFQIEKFILGKSKIIKQIIKKLELIANSKANVYIYGESGTGKEVITDAIHFLSTDENKPLIKVNCSALSSSLLESELFGYEKGAFTGADKTKIGRFEAANGGTIFLDEVSEMNKEIQVKLLRVIQEKKIERVGSNKSIDVDFRLISASNRPLEQEVKKDKFREDLFYRLNVIDLFIPPLRERRGDIEYLAQHFFEEFAQKNNKSNFNVTSSVYNAFNSYEWPGNVRELKNIIEKIVVLTNKNSVTYEDLPEKLKKYTLTRDYIEIPYGVSMEEAEERIIREMIKYCKGNKSRAAKILNITRKTLHRKIKLDENS